MIEADSNDGRFVSRSAGPKRVLQFRLERGDFAGPKVLQGQPSLVWLEVFTIDVEYGFAIDRVLLPGDLKEFIHSQRVSRAKDHSVDVRTFLDRERSKVKVVWTGQEFSI